MPSYSIQVSSDSEPHLPKYAVYNGLLLFLHLRPPCRHGSYNCRQPPNPMFAAYLPPIAQTISPQPLTYVPRTSTSLPSAAPPCRYLAKSQPQAGQLSKSPAPSPQSSAPSSHPRYYHNHPYPPISTRTVLLSPAQLSQSPASCPLSFASFRLSLTLLSP